MEECKAEFHICFSASRCSDNEKSTGYCWIFILCQIGLMVLMTAYQFVNNLGQEQKMIVSTNTGQNKRSTKRKRRPRPSFAASQARKEVKTHAIAMPITEMFQRLKKTL